MMLSCGVNLKNFVLALLLLPCGVRGYKGVKFNSLKLSFNSVHECWSFSVRGIFIFTVLCAWIILHTSIFTVWSSWWSYDSEGVPPHTSTTKCTDCTS